MSELHKRLEVAIEAAKEASKIALKYYGKLESNDVETKKDDSPVTQADLEIDKYLKETILAAFPEDGWLSEETVDDESRLKKSLVWIVDPIDGTKDFIAQNDEFCIMIGLVEDGAPRFGVLALPAFDTIYAGGPDFGVEVYSEGEEVVLPPLDEEGDVILVSRHHFNKKLEPFIEKENLEKLPCGSVGVKISFILEEIANHYIHLGTIGEWDTAAPQAIFEALGGYCSLINGEAIQYNKKEPKIKGFIASTDDRFLEKTVEYFG